MSDRSPLATPSQTVGPFFHLGLKPQSPTAAAASARLRLVVTVIDGDGKPVDDAAIELWQRAEGRDVADFARMPTAKDGTCTFDMARPAGHVNVCVFARGLLRHLHTRIYFEDGGAPASDPVLSLVPQDRRHTLLAHRDPADPALWRFDVRLQGAGETVFFSV